MLFKIVIAAAGSLIGLFYMLVAAAGPGVFLALVSPFDALFSVLFGLGGNLITYLPLLALMIKSSPGVWFSQFIGTRIQQVLFVFILMLSISHFLTLAYYPEAAVLEYLRKLTILIVVGVWAWYMRSTDQLMQLNRALVVSTAAFTLISMADFYLGVGLMPGYDPTVGGVYGQLVEETSSSHSLRYRGGGLPINRTANWLIVPAFIAFGWFMLPSSRRGKIVALVCTVICVTGIFATVGRSAIAGTLVGFLVLMPTAIGLKPTRVLGTAIALFVIGSLGLLAMSQLGFLTLLEERFVGESSEGATTARLSVYVAAIRIWMTAPIFGIGDSAMTEHPLYIGVGAHNSFLGLLAEAGIVGFLPYLVLTLLLAYRFLQKVPGIDPAFDAWRPYFFAGWTASMTQNMFNEYTWERFIWYAVAYLIAHERMAATARAEAAKRRIDQANEAGGELLYDQSSATAL